MELTLDQALQKGVEAHRAGNAQEADRYYTAILKANPKHPDANHNMGVLAVGIGKVQEALPFFKVALEANPNLAQYWLSYIDALIKLERIDEAKAVFDQAQSKGVTDERFVQIAQRLGLSGFKEPNAQELFQDKLKSLLELYNQGKLQQVFNEAQELTKHYTKSLTLWNLMGASAAQTGKLDQAVLAFKKAAFLEPQNAQARYNMGKTLMEQGKLEAATEAFSKAVDLKPDYADAYNNMGIIFKEQGKLEEATEAFNKALSIKPDYAEAFNNAANTLKEQGKLEEAIEAYKKVLSLKPDYAEAFNNLGVTLKVQGKLEEAIEAYTKALSLKPDYADAYSNVGIILKEQGKREQAIDAYTKALSLKPDYAEALNNLSNCLMGVVFTKPNKPLQSTIVSLIDKKRYVRPNEIAKASISLLKFEPSLQKCLQLGNDKAIQNPLDVISDLSRLSLLMKLMSVCPLPDLELEGLLKNLRSSILSNISSVKKASPAFLSFQSALALQCFTNEYIYNYTAEEEKALRTLEKHVKKIFKNKEQPNPQMILVLASYKALNEYDWCKSLDVEEPLREVYTRQVEEPQKERDLKSNLPVLGEITDGISSKVRAQYEESPYPRWVNLQLNFKPVSISNVVDEIKLKLHDDKITEVSKPDILIAGCGTGQHSIGTATRFKSSNVLAVDLSLSSLAYAKRKTEELTFENIEYMQADILDLAKLNKRFDIIESIGVLHHMDNPMAGWKVLTECLKPGGLMRIGLYSELARKHIAKIRKEISKLDIGSSEPEMRSFRDEIIKSEKGHHKLIIESTDFYSMSTLKDLLFHVQEHRFTIPQIKDCLEKLGLKFCGFESKEIVSHFQQTNTDKEDLYDLNKWQAYEEANQKTFQRLYSIWCQKVD